MTVKNFTEQRRRKRKIKFIGQILLLILLVLFIFSGSVLKSSNHHQKTLTITEKERVQDGDSSKYLIFCEDEFGQVTVLENTDSFFNGKFNSSDIYAQLEVGKTYQFDLVSRRWRLLSWYENILYAKEVDVND